MSEVRDPTFSRGEIVETTKATHQQRRYQQDKEKCLSPQRIFDMFTLVDSTATKSGTVA